MRVGVADPTCGDADQNVRRADLGHGEFGILQCVADLHESDTSHKQSEAIWETICKPGNQKGIRKWKSRNLASRVPLLDFWVSHRNWGLPLLRVQGAALRVDCAVVKRPF